MSRPVLARVMHLFVPEKAPLGVHDTRQGKSVAHDAQPIPST
ncbi:MAG: hypothetical protein Q4E06_13385 [Lautropia sp.]|nr:hypothetical protein [Lautropia sp.]